MEIAIKLVFWAGLFLTLKHFIGDGPLQTNYQVENKGKWLHPGGLLHAGIHGAGTFLAVLLAFILVSSGKPMWYLVSFAIFIALADFTVHYLIDITKMKTVDKYGWSELGKVGTDGNKKTALIIHSNKYFWGIVADQAAHFLTYIVIICFLLKILLQTPNI